MAVRAAPLAFLLALAVRAAAAPAAGPAPSPRLIVLISVDTLRADRAARAGLAPNLARFAAGAAAFERAAAQATWTLPSHASMLTSLPPSSHGAGGTGGTSGADWRPISEQAATLAAVLSKAGWRTEAIVSSPVLDARWGFARGFDRYRTASRGPRGEELAFDDAARALARPLRKPLFLFVHSNIVHAYARLKPAKPGEPPRCPLTQDDVLPSQAMRPEPESPSSPRCEDDRRAYDRAVACMDAALGRLLDALDAGPAGPGALVIFTSDHGEVLCEAHPRTPLRGHGFAAYAEQAEVPLIVRLPGGAGSGLRLTAQADETDIGATILDAAGVPAPRGFEGRSLVPLLDGRGRRDADSISEGEGWKALRRGSLEYLRREGGREELYDLAQGRPETLDLSGERPRQLAELRAALDALLAAAPKPPAPPAPGVDARLEQALKAEGYRR